MALDDLAVPTRIEQVGEALWRIVRFDNIGVVADGAEQGERGCVHGIRIDLFGRQVFGCLFRQVRREQPVALPMDKMCRVCAADDIDFIDLKCLFLADALEDALSSRSLHVDGDAGILGFEHFAKVFRDWNFHSGVERDHALLPRGLDHGWVDRGRLRYAALEPFWKNGTNGKHRRRPEHVASGNLPTSHIVRSYLGRVPTAQSSN